MEPMTFSVRSSARQLGLGSATSPPNLIFDIFRIYIFLSEDVIPTFVDRFPFCYPQRTCFFPWTILPNTADSLYVVQQLSGLINHL